jgi:murein tripeptide amidase MpaA
MINADGVVIGNTRSSLFGVDLNRRWREPNSILHPEIYFLKSSMLD